MLSTRGALDYLSVRADVAPPTSQAKGIGGTGSWSVSLLPARRRRPGWAAGGAPAVYGLQSSAGFPTGGSF